MDLVFSRTKKIPSKSWGQECSLCSSRHGVPIECSAPGCKAAYHTTCAIRGKLKMQAIFGKDFKGGIKLRSYCKKHSPSIKVENGLASQADKIDASGVGEIDMTNLADEKSQTADEEFDYFWKYVDINEVHKSISEAYARSKRLKLAALNNRELEEPCPSKKSHKKLKFSSNDSPTPKSKLTKKQKGSLCDIKPDLSMLDDSQTQIVDPLKVDLIYRYWILLRTANNGQSLIKFSPSALKEKEFEQRKSIMKLRIELERVRNLSYMIGKREKLKSAWLKTHQNIIMRTLGLINDLDPTPEEPTEGSDNSNIISHQASQLVQLQNHSGANSNWPGSKKHLSFPIVHQHQHLQTTNAMFDESDQLIHDLITCDQIYEQPPSRTTTHTNLSFQERSTMERRRTLSLVRRINRQLKSVSVQPSLNPYAKNYLAPKRSDSPVGLQQQQQHNSTNKMIKTR